MPPSKEQSEPQKIEFSIDPDNPISWDKIYRRVRPFYRSAVECCGENRPPSPRRRIRIIFKKKQPESEPGFKLMSLPREIIYKILELVLKPYEMEVYMARSTPTSVNLEIFPRTTHMIIDKPRSWASIKLLQVSRELRQFVIERYGQPRKDSLPFNPATDKLVIMGASEFKSWSDVRQVQTMAMYFWSRLSQCLEDRIAIPHGLLCYYDGGLSKRPHQIRGLDDILSILNSLHLLERVRVAEFRSSSVEAQRGLNPQAWAYVLRDLSASLPRLERLEICTYHCDLCILDVVHSPPLYYYRSADLRLLAGILVHAKRTKKNRRAWPQLFPHLKSLEISKTPKCTAWFEGVRWTTSTR
ncbi:hypothetical protein F5Y11DRAFT_367527 [Daldinia sp. FL1419]|nr:hypothetical protein F5Y11DRAFT_367527 [Daldinia sp. FL1419]